MWDVQVKLGEDAKRFGASRRWSVLLDKCSGDDDSEPWRESSGRLITFRWGALSILYYKVWYYSFYYMHTRYLVFWSIDGSFTGASPFELFWLVLRSRSCFLSNFSFTIKISQSNILYFQWIEIWRKIYLQNLMLITQVSSDGNGQFFICRV